MKLTEASLPCSNRSRAFSFTPSGILVSSRTPPAATEPAPARAPPPKNAAKAASPRRIFASCAVNESSIWARFSTPNPSWATSVPASTAPPRKKPLPRSLASRPMTVFSLPADSFLARLPTNFSKAISPPTPIAACGAPTAKARSAVNGSFGSCPDSIPSEKFCPDSGANSEPNAPVIAPRLASFARLNAASAISFWSGVAVSLATFSSDSRTIFLAANFEPSATPLAANAVPAPKPAPSTDVIANGTS